jgi:hypothetical protein
MKKISTLKNYLMLAGLLAIGLASCKKTDPLGYNPGTGAPVISSVRTLGKGLTDSTTKIYTTYDSTGTKSYDTVNMPPSGYSVLDSTTATGNLSNTYEIIGQNLGSTTKLVINGVSVYFNRALGSDTKLVFNIPSNIPTTQPQPNTIVLTTLHGTVTYKFTVLPPPPSILTTSDYDFSAGTQLNFTGVSFLTVTGITIKGTADVVTIVSKTDSTMVVKMPKTSASRGYLILTYTSGTKTVTATSSQEFIDMDNAYQIFANNNFQNTWFDNSWAHPSGLSTAASHSGTASIVASYPANGWQIEGWAGWNSPTSGIPYNPAYTYLTFWVKGGVADHVLVLVGDKMAGGYGQVQNANAYTAQLIKVPANVWTYFKIPLGPPTSTNVNQLNFWANGTPAQQLGFFLQGGLTSTPDVDETLYFDEVAFVK